VDQTAESIIHHRRNLWNMGHPISRYFEIHGYNSNIYSL